MFRKKIFWILALTISLFMLDVSIYANQLIKFEPTAIQPQTEKEINREVIVKFRSNVIQMPTGKDTATLGEITVSSPRVFSLLSRYNTELILKGFPNYDPADSIAISPRGNLVKKPDFTNIYRIRLPEGIDRKTMLKDLDTLSEVIYAETNGMARFFLLPNDPNLGQQWGLHNTGQSGGTPGVDIHAAEAWDIFTGSTNVKIGIIDMGVWWDHPDLSGKVVSGDHSYSDAHGTHVAGIATAKSNNSVGVSGTDWNARIVAKNISSSDMTGIANKIVEAVNEGANVLNNSWGLTETDGAITVRNAFAYAYKMDGVAVVAMGNSYLDGNPINYPAAWGQGIIAVGATTDNGQRSPYSSTGGHIDVVAPGGINSYPNNDQHDIYSTYVSPQYRYLAGTSMASPFVTGLASLLKGYDPDLYNDDIEQIIRYSADNIVTYPGDTGWDEWTGMGQINAYKALNLLRAPNYLAHWSAGGATYVTGISDYYAAAFYSVPGLSDGIYWVRRYTVRQDISFPLPFSGMPYAWGRGVGTLGYSPEAFNFAMGYCKVIDGSVTPTSCTLESHVYKVYNFFLPWIFYGWFPCDTTAVNFAYTALGQPTFEAPTVSTNLVQGENNHHFHITWNDDNTHIPQSQKIYELEMLADPVFWYWEKLLTDSCHAFDYTPTCGGSLRYDFRVRIIVINGDDSTYSEWSNVASIINAPNPPTDVSVGVVSTQGWPNMLKIRPDDHDPPWWPTNKVIVRWEPPNPWDQYEPIDYYEIRIETVIDGSPAVFWTDPIYTLKDSLCLWTTTEYDISVVAFVGGSHSDEMVDARHLLTGGTQICENYSHEGSSFGDDQPGTPAIKNDLTPNQYFLTQNNPNPFNPETDILYSLPGPCHVKLTVYNMLGQKVKTLVDENQPFGVKTIHWDGRDESGNQVSSGIYFYRLDAGNFSQTKKMVMMK